VSDGDGDGEIESGLGSLVVHAASATMRATPVTAARARIGTDRPRGVLATADHLLDTVRRTRMSSPWARLCRP